MESENEEQNNPKKVNLTERLRENPWILSTVVLGIFVLLMLVFGNLGGITGKVISKNNIGEMALDFFNTKLSSTEGVLESVSLNEGVYEVLISVDGDIYPFYFTKKGSYIYQAYGLLPSSEEEESTAPEESISECVADYGIDNDTIIFYHSDSCGWCAKMKPGVEELEGQGYSFYWAEASDSEASEIISECVRDYMTSSGVPQFICVKTGEIHVGAFADENSNLDQEALKEWVDECLAG